MFVLREVWEFPVRFTVTPPAGEEQTLELICRTGPAIGRAIAQASEADDPPAALENALLHAVVDWRDVVDPHGEPVPFDRELFRQLLREVWFAVPFLEAYRRERDRVRGKA